MHQLSPSEAGARRPHIFVLDAELFMLDVMRLLLENECYVVTTSTFVPESFEQIAALQPALLIIDLRLRDRAGWDLLERLARSALTRAIPVIVTSTNPALLREAEAQRARFAGDAWIVKPFDIDGLLGEVHCLIGSR